MSKTGTTDPDDGWGDLARELGLDPPPARPHAPAAAAEAEPEEEGDPLFAAADGQSDLFQEYEPDADGGDAEAESDDGPEEGAEGEPTGEPGEEGPKKKKRRRRRRKKKGGEAGEAGEVAAPTAAGEQDEDDESDGDAEESAETAEGESEEEDAEPARRAPVDDGGPTVEASRELIANWDVPSWEQIVAGLYRPSGGR